MLAASAVRVRTHATLAVVLSLLIFSLPAVGAGTLYVGQVAPLSGPASSIGIPLSQGAHAYFNKVNAGGGINGNRVELLDRDDRFKPEQTMTQVKTLLSERPVIAFVNIVGAPNNGDLVASGLLRDNGLSVVGAFTGATSVRGLKSPDLYFVRAGVSAEARTIVNQLVAMGITQIGLVRANDAFGADAKEQMDQALAAHSLKVLHDVTYAPATVDVERAVRELYPLQPQSIVVFGTGAAASKFVVQYRGSVRDGALIVLSSATSHDVLIAGAGPALARGVGLVQVVPPVTQTTIPIVREYLETLAAHGEKGWKPSTSGLEGYIAAKVLAEAIRRSGGNPTRESVTRALGKLGQLDLGGIFLDFGDRRREGSSYVQIGIVGRDGRLLN